MTPTSSGMYMYSWYFFVWYHTLLFTCEYVTINYQELEVSLIYSEHETFMWLIFFTYKKLYSVK